MKVVQLRYEVSERPGFEYQSPSDVFDAIKTRFDPIQERFYILPTVGQEFEIEELFAGGLSQATVDLKIIFHKLLIKYPNSSTFLIAHNHPSGGLEPSNEDKELTTSIASVSKTLGYRLLDHLIFDDRHFYSFKDHQLL